MRSVLAAWFPLFVAVLTLTACGGGSEGTSERKTTPTEAATGTEPSGTSGDPIACMKEAFIEDAAESGSDMWAGTDSTDGAIVTVERKASLAEAKQAATQNAAEVWTATAGPYYIHGASTEGGDSGTVALVADCLNRP